MTTQSSSVNEELPHHIQALLDLTRETEPPPMRAWLRDYKQAVVLVVVYGFVAFLVGMAGDNHTAPLIFFSIITVMFSLNVASEQQASRRWKLLLKVLWHQSRWEKNATNKESAEIH